jgi:hypothetical protein
MEDINGVRARLAARTVVRKHALHVSWIPRQTTTDMTFIARAPITPIWAGLFKTPRLLRSLQLNPKISESQAAQFSKRDRIGAIFPMVNGVPKL